MEEFFRDGIFDRRGGRWGGGGVKGLETSIKSP